MSYVKSPRQFDFIRYDGTNAEDVLALIHAADPSSNLGLYSAALFSHATGTAHAITASSFSAPGSWGATAPQMLPLLLGAPSWVAVNWDPQVTGVTTWFVQESFSNATNDGPAGYETA